MYTCCALMPTTIIGIYTVVVVHTLCQMRAAFSALQSYWYVFNDDVRCEGLMPVSVIKGVRS